MGWEALAGATVVFLLAILGWIWNLSRKLATQDGRIDAAQVLASGASGRSIELGKDLASFKEHVAANHPSNDALKEITDAVRNLSGRIDNLILHLMPKT